MGEMVTFPSNGGDGPGVPRRRRRAGRARDPGVVGPGRRTSSTSPTASATPGSPPSPPTCTTAQTADRARRRRQADDGARTWSRPPPTCRAPSTSSSSAPATDRSASSATAWAAGWPSSLATQRPDAVKAVAPYYGLIPWPSAQPDWSRLDAKVVGEYAELDESFPPGQARALRGAAARPRQGRHDPRPRGLPPRLLQRRPPGGVLGRARAGGVGAHARAVPRGARRRGVRRAGAQTERDRSSGGWVA